MMQFPSGFVPAGKPPIQQQPTSPTCYSLRANNAFADLSLGKVLSMSCMHDKVTSSNPTVQSQTAASCKQNFDDLLGL
ncbi:hypothetical protein KIN20_021848 [Parelaphostrongylus tenuis]|uniref:Uncharacterized protein n=1 Tax=Parelaphostrongylus tenuis TaxID=148309 RepID=A0AAD5NB54_PARTN|nr:hypothetical protein KIN20_021848 [Parelaphostrongylus tenuis]